MAPLCNQLDIYRKIREILRCNMMICVIDQTQN